MDKEKLNRQKEILKIIKDRFGIPVLTVSLIISIVACHYKGSNSNDNYETNSIETTTESTTEEITEALTEMTTEEVTEALTEMSTEEVTEYITEEKTTEEVITNDELILNEFEENKKEIEELIDKKDIETAKEKGREYFIKSVDFIFYDSEINGITYDELKEDAKEELFEELCEMDELISSVSPDYKENLSNKYEIVKDFTKEKYYYSLDKIKEYIGEERYDQVTQFKEDTKDTVNEFIDDHQDEIDNAKDIIDEKSDEYKLKLKNWYEDYREEE